MSRKPAVCILPAFLPQAPGGVAAHVRALAKHLPRQGWRIVKAPDEADIVHVHALDRAAEVDVYTNHGIFPLHDDMPQWQQQANRAIFDNLKLANQVIAVSQWTSDQWRHMNGVQPHIIGNGVDLDAWRNVPTGRWRAKLSTPPGRPLVVWGKTHFSDVLDPTPAIELALRRPEISVVMPVDKRLLQQPPANLHLVGPQSFASMQMLLADCDVYLATVCENHSIQLLEVLALGKPVLGYAHGGTLETLADNPAGVLLPPGDLAALAAGLDTALESATVAAQAGPELIFEKYQWSDIVARVTDVYTLALEAKRLTARSPVCSIIIPCYNKAAYVGEAIRSALRQANAPVYDVIVVDDGSTDNSLEEIRKATKGDPGVTVITQANAGVAAARNTGIAAARGRYICCLDADDWIEPLFLQRLTAALDADPGLGIAYSDMTVFGHTDEGLPFGPSVIPCDEYSFDLLKRRNFIPCCNLFRKTAWQRAGGYKSVIDQYGPSWEDYEFWLNLGKLGWYGRRVPGGLFHYRKLQQTGRAYDSRTREAALRGIVNRLHRDLYPPLVSVVIPCFKQSAFLTDAIDSALAQTFPDLEIVVVDDGNAEPEADAIWDVVARYAEQDVRLVSLRDNSGLAEARNAGARAARGSWLVPLDADDKLAPGWLNAALVACKLDPNRFAYTDSVLWWPAEDREKVLEAHDYDFDELLRRVTWACTILVSKQAWQQVGGYKPQMSDAGGWEDWEFAISLGEIGVCGVRAPEPLFYYRQHSASQMRFTAESRKPLLQETMRRLHAATYRGERNPMCCGSGQRTIPQQERAAEPAQPTSRAAKNGNGTGKMVMVRYVGQSMGTQQWQGPSGRVYRFGLSEPLQQVLESDVSFFSERPNFRVVTA